MESKAFQQPDVVIVNEVNWTPTARMADIVLPATTSYERNSNNLNRLCKTNKKRPHFD